MNALLIYPRFKYENAGGVFAPLGLQYIAAAVKEQGHEVSLIDMTFQDKLVISENQLKDVDVVGISFSSPLASRAYQVLESIKRIKPDLICIAGGSHPTISPEECLIRGFDIAVLGEGEHTINDLLEKLEASEDLNAVDGIAFLKDGKIILTKPRPFISNLDDLPFPARELVDMDAYLKSGSGFTVIASRGCPYNCLFCKPMQDKLFGKKIRRRTVINVVNELEGITQKGKKAKRVVTFVDDTLLCSKDWVLSFCDEIKKRRLRLKWACQARADNINREILEAIKEIGCFHISIGVESGSQKILDFLRKGIRVEDSMNALNLCHKVGINTHAYIIIGSPMETKNDLEATINLIKRTSPCSLQVARLTPIPGSDLYDYAVKHDLINVKALEEYDYYSTGYPLRLSYLSRVDLDRFSRIINGIKKDFLIRRIAKPSYFRKIIIESLRSPSSLIRRIKNFVKLF